MSEMSKQNDWKFVHSKAESAEWKPGLRKIFDYRDLGVKDGSNGEFVAHVIRHNGKQVDSTVQDWHRHECDFQMVYVIKGTATFEFEGEGVLTFKQGDCILQRPHIKHREIECSSDYEVLEIVAPGNFATRTLPEG